MKTTAQYRHDIQAIHPDEIKTEGLTADQARANLDEAEAQLRAIERALNLDLHALRSQFQGRASALNIQNAKKSGRNRAEDEERLQEEETSRLAPYEDVKKEIEAALQKIEGLKASLVAGK